MNSSAAVALAGNPNVGKSVIFRCLTGTYAEVSNYPGTTVDMTWGMLDDQMICDTPGVFGLTGLNEEEIVARRAIEGCDFIVDVADATTLSRDLFLTLQLLSLNKPMLLVVNMMDQAERYGIHLDVSCLSAQLGIPVIPMAAARNRGVDDLLSAVRQRRFSHGAIPTSSSTPSLQARAARIAEQCVSEPPQPFPTSRMPLHPLDRLIFHPLGSILLLAALMAFLWFFLGQFLSQTVVNLTQGFLMDRLWYDAVIRLFGPLLSEDGLASSLLLGEYGLLTTVPSYVFGLLLPLVAGFHLVMALLEDSGILPRLAVLTDRPFSAVGLNGKAVIPMLSGFGCVTMALISTRILSSRRERLLCALLLCTAIPCSAQLSILLAVAHTLPPTLLFFYGAAILLLFTAAATCANALLPGTSSPLFLTLPPLRLPQIGNVLRKTVLKSKAFLTDAVPLFLLVSAWLSVLNYCDGFVLIHRLLLPLTGGLLHLPPQAATLLFMCLVKRDLGAAYLFSLVSRGLLTPVQTTVCLITTTLFVPCFASLAVLAKEQGFRTALLIWLFSAVLAFAAGGLASALLM
ncbi:MAG: ferrous iron transporter B [Firmicutes bacterium]|nr:ferrous iron transporter B [Bacillota bacterium]